MSLNMPVHQLRSLYAQLMSMQEEVVALNRKVIGTVDTFHSGWQTMPPSSLSQIIDGVHHAARNYEDQLRDLSRYIQGLADSLEQTNSIVANVFD